MTTALGPADVLCRLLTTLYFSLFSFFCITVICFPLSDGIICMLRRMEATVAIDLRFDPNHMSVP